MKGLRSSDYTVLNEKVVYENDSIALIQFIGQFNDTTGTKRYIELCYTYLYDGFMSNIERRPIFCEQFREMRNLSDDEIREKNRQVKETNESVYLRRFGGAIEVAVPFDK